MQLKSSHYKSDFKFKFGKNKYNPENCVYYNNSSYYRSRGLLSAIHLNYMENSRDKDFWDMMVTSDIPQNTIASDVELFYDFVKSGKSPENYVTPDGMRNYNLGILIGQIAKSIAKRTPEFAEAKKSFDEWIKTRPGVLNVYKEYRQLMGKINPNITQENPEYPTLESFAYLGETRKFKLMLENARPLKFSAGDVVKLKPEYHGKRGKDPLYYSYDNTLKSKERIGTVMKKTKTVTNYGIGSREIRVLWFMDGQETHVMERCLKLLESEDTTPAATNE